MVEYKQEFDVNKISRIEQLCKLSLTEVERLRFVKDMQQMADFVRILTEDGESTPETDGSKFAKPETAATEADGQDTQTGHGYKEAVTVLREDIPEASMQVQQPIYTANPLKKTAKSSHTKGETEDA